ncbi:hypothetical protein [Sulfitobacter pacificus]|uniref:hypothetical protein n=1 Tax=Sulfitobacter pacificus TaxID=1499314 RepID=UPI003342496F
MEYRWTDWQDAETASEYVHWFLDTEPGEERINGQGFIEDGLKLLQLFPDSNLAGEDAFGTSPLVEPADYSRPTVSRKLFEKGLPLPPQTINDEFKTPPTGLIHWLPEPENLPDNIDNDTIVMGVIDTGIPLGHHRWRDETGVNTRVLASWQMLADWGKLNQTKLPFGREVYANDIDKLIAAHTNDGYFDERSFNIDTGVLDPHEFRGPRQVEQRASHGAHVMDLCAGADPELGEEEFCRRVRPIAVNVPSAGVFGASGTYLDDFLLLAVKRIVDLADAAWLKNNPSSPSTVRRGYPIVINMSFGKQAGAKDFIDPFSAFLRDLKDYRKDNNLSRLYVTMPAGNDNLTRCNAFLEPQGGETMELPWRVLPEDRSSNFVEVWTRHPNSSKHPIKLNLVPPGTKKLRPPGSFPKDWKGNYIYTDLMKDSDIVARLYARSDDIDGRPEKYLKYTMSLPPTYRLDGNNNVGIAGAWNISATNKAKKSKLQCVLSVQTDQRLQSSKAQNKRSYFDEVNYLTHDNNHADKGKRGSGRVLETYSYPPNFVKNNDYPFASPVRRHGTLNASVSHKAIACIGGYRALDGRPAPYSSSGRGRSPQNGQRSDDDGTIVERIMVGARFAPTASFPTDDAPSHFGILAAGSNNGSVTPMRGTSFACAQAARELVHSLFKNASSHQGDLKRLASIAAAREKRIWPHRNKFNLDLIDVLGAGRIERPGNSRVERL